MKARGKMPLYTLIALVTMFLSVSYATIINIPDDYETIIEGITASISGDTVMVAPGLYSEYIVSLQGKNILLTSSNGPDTTTIHGYIYFENGEDSTCILQGFTIWGWGTDPGTVPPAILCEGATKPKIIGNIVKNNTCMGINGGGIGIIYGSAIIRHNIIENNYAMGHGGGICSASSDIEISNNIIRNNYCSGGYNIGWGGGIYCCSGMIFNNLIYGNEAGGYPSDEFGRGGGIYLYPTGPSSFAHIYNNTIVGNFSQRYNSYGNGGGMLIAGSYYYDTVIVENNIIAFNHNGGIISTSSNGVRVIELEYNLFYENTKYDLWKADTSETLIFDQDPLFADTSENDYSLLEGSPCIDAGDPDYPLDPDSTRVDIGALFYDQRTGINDEDINDRYTFELHQNYPNPFNAQTTIEYTLPQPSAVSLIVFDITGRVVKTLLNNEFQNTGNYSYIWDGTNKNNEEVSTAIYFYQLKINNKRRVKSMILIK